MMVVSTETAIGSTLSTSHVEGWADLRGLMMRRWPGIWHLVLDAVDLDLFDPEAQ